MAIADPKKRAEYNKKYWKKWYAKNRKRHIKNVREWTLKQSWGKSSMKPPHQITN